MDKEKALVVSKKISKGDKYIPSDWLPKFFGACENIRDEAYLRYHVETGLRVSDVVNTQLVHVDWQQCKTYTYDKKKDVWRWVYFPEKIKGVLKQWLKFRQATGVKDERLFPFSEKTANRIIKDVALRVGFPFASQISSHWCRHTFIRLSRRAGRDIKAVQQNTGDTIRTLLEWYSDLSSEDMREEIDGRNIT